MKWTPLSESERATLARLGTVTRGGSRPNVRNESYREYVALIDGRRVTFDVGEWTTLDVVVDMLVELEVKAAISGD